MKCVINYIQLNYKSQLIHLPLIRHSNHTHRISGTFRCWLSIYTAI